MPAGGNCVDAPPSAALLGFGAYGHVWRAQDRRTRQEFAVKSVHARDAERERQIFQHLRGWAHPCVVEVFQFERIAGSPFCAVVMQLCANGDLSSQITRARREAEAVGTSYEPTRMSHVWAGHVFLGLEHLHLHTRMLLLDLKPANVLLSEGGVAKLADFGASRLGTGRSSSWYSEVPPGTAGYTAPEVLRQETHDYRADLYSFGALLWVLFTGGIAANPHPQPPSSKMGFHGHWAALFDDWRLLRAQMTGLESRYMSWSYPTSAALGVAEGAPVDIQAQDLVLGLCTRQPHQRLTHAGIRQHPFMEQLQLPALEDHGNELQMWLADRSLCCV